MSGEQIIGGGARSDLVTFREHTAAKEAMEKRMSTLELEQASQRAALMHLPADMRQLTNAVNTLATKINSGTASPHQPDHVGLAIHHLAEELKKSRGGGSPLLVGLAVVGIMALVVGGVLITTALL